MRNEPLVVDADMSRSRIARRAFEHCRLTCRHCGEISKLSLEYEAKFWVLRSHGQRS